MRDQELPAYLGLGLQQQIFFLDVTWFGLFPRYQQFQCLFAMPKMYNILKDYLLHSFYGKLP